MLGIRDIPRYSSFVDSMTSNERDGWNAAAVYEQRLFGDERCAWLKEKVWFDLVT